ncbi:aldo/keto reductase [Streptomyces sp. HK10]|uniref:aldo/keto reductase n=1 Tax=Streptomyces sp. HK10 TaxID=3373255 RepID=UPI00374A5AA8
MRRQLETSLENLRTDYLDIYFFHHSDFGPDDRYLEPAVAQMRAFQREGLIKTIGMRGPHRFATERLTVPKQQRDDKYARFAHLAEVIRPDYLAARFNALTPPPAGGRPDIFALAASMGASVLVNKPLAQGLLTGKHHPGQPPVFGVGDHRLRKAWFTPGALAIIHDHLAPLRDRFGHAPGQLARVFVHYCLHQADHAAVLVGFTRPEQTAENLAPLDAELTADDLAFISQITGRLQQALDAHTEVFVDEKGTER